MKDRIRASVVRELADYEGGYMPARELLEPLAGAVNLAITDYESALIEQGVRQKSGRLLVRLSIYDVDAPFSVSVDDSGALD